MASVRLLLIRHGETTWNAERRWQGHSDPPLSSRGEGQARALATQLKSEHFAALISSDLRRAVQTARIVGAPHGLEPIQDTRLRELDVGAWEGLHRAEIKARWPNELAAFDAAHPDASAVDGESRRQLAERVHAALNDWVSRYAEGPLAVVAHGGVVRAAIDESAAVGNAEARWLDWRAT